MSKFPFLSKKYFLNQKPSKCIVCFCYCCCCCFACFFGFLFCGAPIVTCLKNCCYCFAIRPMLFYPEMNWVGIWSSRPSHADIEERCVNSMCKHWH